MNLELFLAAVILNVAISAAVYLRLSGRKEVAEADLGGMKQEIADLITELNHVANTHVNAIEERKAELTRTIDLANDRIRRLGVLVSDAEIVSGRAGRAGRTPIERRVKESAAGGGDGRYDEVIRMAGEGLGADEIAGRTRMGRGEVELVLGLKNRDA